MKQHSKEITKGKYYFVMLVAMFLPLLASLFYFVIFSESRLAQLFYVSIKIFTIVWPIIVYHLIWKIPFPSLKEKEALSKEALISGCISGLLILTIMTLFMLSPFSQGIIEGKENILQKAQSLGVLKNYWLFAIFISLAHSFIEEYYWRWFVFSELRKRISPFFAYFLAAASFSAHHVVILSQYFSLPYAALLSFSVGVGGALWSYMWERQKTLLGTWVSHALVDLGIFAIGHSILFA